MATRVIPYYTVVTDYDQSEEDALAVILIGADPYSSLIFNTTIGKTRIWDGVAFANAPLLNPDGGSWAGGSGYDGNPATIQQNATNRFVTDTEKTIWSNKAPLIPQEFTFIGALTAWTNKNVALQEFLNTNQRRLTIDMANATQFRIILNVTTQGASASVTGVQYSTDGGTTFRGLDNGNSGSNSTVTLSDLGTGSKVSAWTNLAAGAKADVILRIAGSGGDGALDPAFSNISLQIK